MVGYSLDLEDRYIQEGRLRRLARWMLITYRLKELAMRLKDLAIFRQGKLWYTFDDEDWVAVRIFRSDSDVIEMINKSRVKKRKVLNIYVEHEIDEADLVGEDISEEVGHGVGVEGLGEGVGGEGFGGEGVGGEGLGETLGEDLKDGVSEDHNDVEGEREEGSDYGTDLSDFPEFHDDEPDAYEEVRNEEDASGDTARNVDWLGAFTSTAGGGKDEGVELETLLIQHQGVGIEAGSVGEEKGEEGEEKLEGLEIEIIMGVLEGWMRWVHRSQSQWSHQILVLECHSKTEWISSCF
ncbi:hypothetical protein CJ030_MR1G029328 [Morella rubra]|uniref:Uncharacterized protein n=1 Tax=Morella rubra TaxID=262757 RepID=A0A6A1WQK3_9ROSI|nr:hypothetical protein CJ030_MR1G029328 [Morella rubra]